jgi:acetylornithine/N-succinyldiaminopimelate aminotransferase
MSAILIPEVQTPAAPAAPDAAPVGGSPATTPDDAILATYKRAPMTIVGGRGVELIDSTGRAYLDFTAGIAVNALGYGDAGLARVMHEAIDTGVLHTSNLYRTAPGEALAELLVAKSFADRVFFCNSGAEANEGAFKFARRWARANGGRGTAGEGASTTGSPKHEIISLRGAFHGRLFGTLAATDRPGYRMPFRPLAGGVSIAERDIEELSASISAETTAAVVLEPIQGEGGVRVLDAGFVRELRALTAERDVLLVFDEIQCGLGRTGTLFAYEQLGVTPDILTLAKPIAGGLPMGAILMTADVASAVQPGDHGTTFGGGPFVASVAKYVVERLSDPALLAHVRDAGAKLGAGLHAIAARTGRVRAVRGMGFMWGLDTMAPAGEVVARALELGLLIVTAGDHTVRLLPPLVMSDADVARGLELLERAIIATHGEAK